MKNSGIVKVLALLLPAACSGPSLTQPNFVSSRDQAAGVTMSVTAAPWNEVSATIQPKFALPAASALQQIVPVTQQGESEAESATGAGLGLSFLAGPFKAPASSTASASNLPSSLPAATIPTGTPAGGSLPSAASAFSPAVNPALMYTAAASLYESVQLLNAELTSATIRKNYVPYVVRIRLGILPYRPNLPYDLIAHISFFNAPDCLVAGLPTVLPLLATDDLERASESEAAQASSQLSLALGFLAPYVGGNANLNHIQQRLEALSGQNFDSTLTVAREVDNTLVVRIGAAYQASGGKAIIGQNYDIATVLLVPSETLKCKQKSISVASYTEFRNTFTGAALPARSVGTIVQAGDSAVATALPSYSAVWMRYPEHERFGKLDDMLDDVQTNTYQPSTDNPKCNPGFLNHVKQSFCPLPSQNASKQEVDAWKACEKDVVSYAQPLWARLSEINTDSSYETAAIDLNVGDDPIAIPKQYVTVEDDGKTNATAELRISPTAYAGNVAGTLNIATKNGKSTGQYAILSQSGILDAGSDTLTVTFPSLSNLGIAGITPEKSFLQLSVPCEQGTPVCPKIQESTFPISYILAKGATGPAPDFTFTSGSKAIGELLGSGNVILSLSKLVGDETATISVDGAQIVAAAGGTLMADGVVSGNGLTTLSLSNLVPNVAVTITAQGKTLGVDSGKTSIVLPVVSDASQKEN